MTSRYDDLCAKAYDWMRRLVKPTLRNSHYEYCDRLREYLRGRGRWLDLGCGHSLLPAWFSPDEQSLDLTAWKTVGIDFDESALRRHHQLRCLVRGNIERLPFDAQSFHLVSANMVVEHVESPHRLFAEISRVLVGGGRLIIHTPNRSGYTTVLTRLVPKRLLAPLAALLLKRDAADVYPTYYNANSQEALAAIANACGLRIDFLEFVHSSPQFIRLPPLMAAEMTLIRSLERASLSGFRACIVAGFTKDENQQSRNKPVVSDRFHQEL